MCLSCACCVCLPHRCPAADNEDYLKVPSSVHQKSFVRVQVPELKANLTSGVLHEGESQRISAIRARHPWLLQAVVSRSRRISDGGPLRQHRSVVCSASPRRIGTHRKASAASRLSHRAARLRVAHAHYMVLHARRGGLAQMCEHLSPCSVPAYLLHCHSA